MPNTLTGPSIPPKSGTVKQLIIILHGWGADGDNLIDLGEAWSNALPDAHFIAPHGHEVCEVNPFGRQWFSLTDRTPEVLLAGVRKAADVINPWLDAQLETLGLTNDKLALVGFSQGTMTALHVALRRQPQLSCVLGYSGALLADERLMHEEVSAHPPVCLIHGESDDVVPFARMREAEALLEASKINVITHARPGLPHSIDMEGVAIGQRFLVERLGVRA